MNKTVIILRGAPGSGKSTFCKTLDSPRICSADFFFNDKEGNYKFDASKLGMAHKYCMTCFTTAIKYNEKLIVIDNTNIHKKHYQDYVTIAKANGYEVYQKVMSGCYTNVHGVPTEKVSQMRSNFEIDTDLPHLL